MLSSVPPGHKLLAVVVAAATASGLYAFLHYREAQSAFAASLSYVPAVAQQLDPGIACTPHPAVVLGQSILSDSVIASLAPTADLAASSTAQAIGEFRTRVELTQPSAGLLLVRYRDPAPDKAAATANLVAKALAGWAPLTVGDLPDAQPAPASGRGPSASAAPRHAPAGRPSPAAALDELRTQLSMAAQRVGPDSSLRSEHDRQRYLEVQVRAAQQQLDDLRNQLAHSGSARGEQARLDAIGHALALFWPSAGGFNTAGTSEAQLDYERQQIARAIFLIAQQKQAAERGEASNPASASQPQSGPLAAVSSPSDPGERRNPLRLEREARLPSQVDWWPAALTGCLCGLLYWGLAFARHRSSSEPDDLLDPAEVSAASAFRFFDLDASLSPNSHQAPSAVYPVEASSPQPARLNFDPGTITQPVPVPSPEPISDAWEEQIRRNLSQTIVARMINPQFAAEDVPAAKGPARDPGPLPSEPDRLAG